LESLENQTADAIGSAVARVVGALQDRGFIVCAVVKDNASNEKASLDPESSKSAQQKANVPLFRIPCLSHTASLAVGGPRGQSFGENVMKDMRTIRDALPHAMIVDRFYGMPSIVETRWLCLGEFTAYIDRHYPEVADALAAKEHASSVLHRCRFADLCGCLAAMNRFVKWTEGDGTGLCCACEQILRTMADFQQLRVRGNLYASDFEAAFSDRRSRTADLRQILLAFLVTWRGLSWFQSLPLWSPDPRGPIPRSRQSVVLWTGSVRRRFETIIGADSQNFARTWTDYLHHAEFREDDSVLTFWHREQGRTSSFGWGWSCRIGQLHSFVDHG
jgi:hypothetical protein